MTTPTEALRRCVEVLRLVDFADCGEKEELWQKLAAVQAEAERVLVQTSEADEEKILAEFNTWFGPVVDDSNAHNQAIHFWAQEAYRAGRLAAPVSAADAKLPEKMSMAMREAMWEGITRHGLSNLEYWIENLYNDIRAAALKE
jgi:hypothetical protein